MKKIITIAMVFCVLLCCIGCSSRNSGEVVSNPPEDNTSSESNTPITDSQSEDSYQPYDSTIEPPHILVFDSFEQMAELQKMLDEDDEIIYEYLRSKNYVMNGLSSKNDVVEFFKIYRGLGNVTFRQLVRV